VPQLKTDFGIWILDFGFSDFGMLISDFGLRILIQILYTAIIYCTNYYPVETPSLNLLH
jgi:hypothetical protein